MKEQLISFETAKLAKEKGFSIPAHSYYFEDGEFKENSLTGTNGYYGEDYEFNLEEFYENWNDKWLTKKSGDRCFGCSKSRGYFETFSAPTQSLLQKFIRETRGVHIEMYRNASGWYWGMSMTDGGTDLGWSEFSGPNDSGVWDSFEEALEDALQTQLSYDLPDDKSDIKHWSNYAEMARSILTKE